MRIAGDSPLLIFAGLLSVGCSLQPGQGFSPEVSEREEVVFWHFWGGADRDVVDDVVARFNDSQADYYVRAIPMPGNNLQAKLFLSIAGGDPPDLVNQDDPIVGDWASRGAITPIDEVLSTDEAQALSDWMFPAASRLGSYEGRLFAICNGIDIRALYYNQSALDVYGLTAPQSTEDLAKIASTITPPGQSGTPTTFGYLPDARRLWAWGIAFGGQFYDDPSRRVTLDSVPIRDAVQWMTTFSKWYGPDVINAFRQGDQSLPGKTFPLLPIEVSSDVGRYVVLMDGQWRTRDIKAFQKKRSERGLKPLEFGVCPLPYPPAGKPDAGWVNGNFFVVPAGAKNPHGAVAFAKFWIGIENPEEAARTCAAGGWIPVSPAVVEHPEFRSFLSDEPLFAEFVRLASSENQFPVPVIPGAPFFKRTVEQAAATAIADPATDVRLLLERTNQRIQSQLDRQAPKRE